MITCPWCGTNYVSFQSNCSNCGGILPVMDNSRGSSTPGESQLPPPPAPRSISNSYVWKLLSSDGWSIAALVFVILGAVFSLTGTGLTIAVITAFVGIPFLLLGLLFLLPGLWVLKGRYGELQNVVEVLRNGMAETGLITETTENYSVTINGRNPWIIRYQFQAAGQNQEGKVTTLNQPGPNLQAGKNVQILYLPDAPEWNSIYPHP